MGLIEIFHETMRVCAEDEELVSAINASVAGQQVIMEDEDIQAVPPRFDTPMNVYISPKRTFEAAKAYTANDRKICVLNFASFVTPGGGVLKGSRAQEESLCRASTLYPALTAENAGIFYTSHREKAASGLSVRKNNDDCIYTPGVAVVREDFFDGKLLPPNERFCVDVITCAAPDQRRCDRGMYKPADEELFYVMKRRIERILTIAAFKRADVLILGAFGCGAFGNPPKIVAKAFEAALENYKKHFETVEFAVYCRDTEASNYLEFLKISGIIPKPIC